MFRQPSLRLRNSYRSSVLRSSDLAASSSHRPPASVILIRPTAIALPVSLCTVASPARTSLASIWRVKPWTCMTASVAPNGLQASNRSARLCSPPRRRFRGLTVIACDIVRIVGKAPPVRAGQVRGGRSHEVSCWDIPGVSESFAGGCRVANTGLKNRTERAIFFVRRVEKATDGRSARSLC
jgi:hypothetical protein